MSLTVCTRCGAWRRSARPCFSCGHDGRPDLRAATLLPHGAERAIGLGRIPGVPLRPEPSPVAPPTTTSRVFAFADTVVDFGRPSLTLLFGVLLGLAAAPYVYGWLV